MKIIILGPPGSGKGTRAHIISEIFDLPVITTGDMLRGAIREKTEYGLEAKTSDAETVDTGGTFINGLDLPLGVLRKLYLENANRLYPVGS